MAPVTVEERLLIKTVQIEKGWTVDRMIVEFQVTRYIIGPTKFLLTALPCTAPAITRASHVPICYSVKDIVHCTDTDKTYITLRNICANDFHWPTANLTMCQNHGQSEPPCRRRL